MSTSRQVDAIQMGTHNICHYKENHKDKKHIKSFVDFFKCNISIGRYTFYQSFSYFFFFFFFFFFYLFIYLFLKNLSAQCGN